MKINRSVSKLNALMRVQFLPSDHPCPHLEPTAKRIADFLFTYKSQFKDFCEFMRISSTWTLHNYKEKLQRWSNGKVPNRKKAAPDTLKLIELTREFFEVCQNEDDRKKMRGLVPEKLFEKVFGLRHICKKGVFGYGVMVVVDGKEVKYIPSSPYVKVDDSDVYRQTVDAGFWDGETGEFAEVKFSPEAFHTKDIKYLQVLTNELQVNELNHAIFLVCFDQKELIRFKLQRLGLWEKSEPFFLIGRDELFQWGNEFNTLKAEDWENIKKGSEMP